MVRPDKVKETHIVKFGKCAVSVALATAMAGTTALGGIAFFTQTPFASSSAFAATASDDSSFDVRTLPQAAKPVLVSAITAYLSGSLSADGLDAEIAKLAADGVITPAQKEALLDMRVTGELMTQDTLDKLNGKVDPEPPAPEPPAPVEPDVPTPTPAPAPEPTPSAPADNGAEAANQAVENLPSSGHIDPVLHSRNFQTDRFVAVVGEQARAAAQRNGVYASVIIAQAILESDSGNSWLSQEPNNNIFNTSGEWRGSSVITDTTQSPYEQKLLGATEESRHTYCKYDSVHDSIEDNAYLTSMVAYNRFRTTSLKDRCSLEEACEFVQSSFGKSKDYAEKLMSVIDEQGLTRFDSAIPYTLDGKFQAQAVNRDTGEGIVDKDGNPVMESVGASELIGEATKWLGLDYVFGGSTPEEGLDCSGLTSYTYKATLGIQIPRLAEDQWKAGQVVSFQDLQPGDLLFFTRDTGVYHVAMYLTDGYFIESPMEGAQVKVTAMDELTPAFAARILTSHTTEAGEAESGISAQLLQFMGAYSTAQQASVNPDKYASPVATSTDGFLESNSNMQGMLKDAGLEITLKTKI